MVLYSQIQHPYPKGESALQNICLKLLRLEWNDPYAALYGRSGQKQQGVDICGSDKRGGFEVAGCQCKGSEKHHGRIPTIEEFETEVKNARAYKPALNLLIFAYAGDRDTHLQEKAREITKDHKAKGLFEVRVWSWEDIVDRAEPYNEMRADIYIQDGYIELVLDPKRARQDTIADDPSLAAVAVMPRSAILVETTRPALPADALAEAQIDILRDQIRSGSGATVIEPLRNLIARADASTSPHVLFRLRANLGAALEQAGQSEEASIEFERAFEAEPEVADAVAFKSRALLGRGDRAQAFDVASEALALSPEQNLAAFVLINAAPQELAAHDLEARVGLALGSADVATALAGRYSDEGLHDDALRIARAIKDEEPAASKQIAISIAILQGFENNINARMGLPLSDADAQLVKEARELLEAAWGWAKSRPDVLSWLFVAANLVAAYRLAGLDTIADDLAIEVYGKNPDDPHLAERAMVAYVHKHDTARAAEVATKLASNNEPRSALMAADITNLAGDWPAALQWADTAYSRAQDDQDRARAAERLVVAISHVEGGAAALSRARAIRPTFRSDVGFEARVAEIARRSGDQMALMVASTALGTFDRATLSSMDRLDLANAYADDGKWADAASLLEGLYSLDRATFPLRQRLFFLYRADERGKAREFYESLHGEALKSKEILRLGAAIYEKAGMLPEALRALEEALELDPANLRSRLDWALMRLRNGDEGRVRKWAERASTDVEGDAEDLLEFAQLLDRYGRRADALRLGYGTMRRHWGETERVHLLFMSLFLLHTKIDALLDVHEVAPDTVVFLRSDNGTLDDYRIEESGDVGPGVLKPTQPFAQQLLGKKVGDTITPAESIGQSETWTVLAIKHKYLDLFHRAMEAHASAFPGSSVLGRFTIEADADAEASFEPIFEQVRERSRVVDQAVKVYKDNLIPLDTIAKVLGLNPIDAAKGIRYQSGVALEACVGSEPERRQAQLQLRGATRLLVDGLTLSIWQEIGLFPLLDTVEGVTICLVQATLDLLGERVEEARSNLEQAGGSLQAQGDKVALIEPSQAERQSYLDNCSELLEWARSHAQLVPTEPLQDSGQATSLLSHATIATLGTLVSGDFTALFEDRRLRVLAASFGAIKLSWTQALLMSWVEGGKLERLQYVKLTARLFEAKISFVSIAGDDLLAYIDAGESELLPTLTAILEVPTVEALSLANVMTNFIAPLWLLPQYNDRREKLSSIMFEVVLKRPDWLGLLGQVFGGVRRAILSQGFPMSLITRWWREYFERFLRGHFIFDLVFSPPTPPTPLDVPIVKVGRRRRRERGRGVRR